MDWRGVLEYGLGGRLFEQVEVFALGVLDVGRDRHLGVRRGGDDVRANEGVLPALGLRGGAGEELPKRREAPRVRRR